MPSSDPSSPSLVIITQLQDSAAASNTSFACHDDHEAPCQCFFFFTTTTETTTTTTRTLRQQLFYLWKTKVLESIVSLSNGDDNNKDDTVAKGQEWFDKLWGLHTQESRFYHTAVHLEEMCYLLDLILTFVQQQPQKSDHDTDPPLLLLNPSDSDETAIYLAIFFHDAIYQAPSSTNEQDSAQLFQEFCADIRVPSHLAARVTDFILATQHHQYNVAAESSSSSSSQALALFLDLDMAVLGKQHPSAYLSYAALVRKEYLFVPHDTYCQKRAEVLQGFLESDIFATAPFRRALEARAKANLRAEIELLQQRQIPGDES